MALKPTAWSVIIAGRWNPALFTPAEIQRRLFKLDADTPIEVLVQVDDVAPPKVKHNGLTVSADQNRLVVETASNSYEALAQAMALCESALAGLPNTPVSAVGINVRYRGPALPDAVASLLKHRVDDTLSDLEEAITGRGFLRVLRFKDGRVNMQISQLPDEPADLLFNFDRRSKQADDLMAWLRIPVADVRAEVEKLLFTVVKVQAEELRDDQAA